ncbi:MAG TPA: DUF421 domain-containing protein [Firmicutes bacterium]|nr:DUF421 domain-containing protein [Bacillota bacterium]
MNETNLIGDLDIIFRSIVSILVLFTLTRLMGKKHIANLTFFDYIVGISIGSIASQFAVDESIPYFHGIIALIVYTGFAVIISKVSLKGVWWRRVLGDTPTILIQKGEFIKQNLKKTKFTINDLAEEARLNGIFSIRDIDYAILETSGKVSFLLKPKKQNATIEDLNLDTHYKGLEAELIIDGTVMYEHLNWVKKDEQWLNQELSNKNICLENVFFASMNEAGQLNIFVNNPDIHSKDVLE